ncbi:MAG: xanthine dehydrogenase accessory protein XdhC [Opitutaceae bacterium]
MNDCYANLAELEREGTAFTLVVLVEAVGSTPQDAGAKMIVTAEGRRAGTVGGGRVEAQAIAFAQELLAATGPVAAKPRLVTWSLKADAGMTCGGTVKYYFEPHPPRGAGWPIAIFGAGHVTQALVPVLLPLRCSLTVCDSRPEWLQQLPHAPNLRVVQHASPADLVPDLPDNTFVLCMTKGHATDRPILQRALAERDFPFVAVIGSAAKAAILRRELIAGGLTPERAERFHCPAGLEFGSNHPHEIALSIAAQLLTVRDRTAKPAQ